MKMRDDYEFSIESLNPRYDYRLDSRKGLMLGLCVTTACNYKCPMCFYHASCAGSIKPIHISVALVDSVLCNLDSLALVNISLQGEPLLHPAIFEILEISERHADIIVICTNGSLLDRKVIESLERIKPLKLAVSLDACDPQTYTLIRGNRNFDSIIRNIRMAAEILGERLEMNFVLCEQNRDSLQSLPDMAAKLGVRQVNLSMLRETAMTRINGFIPLENHIAQEFASELGSRCEEREVKLGFDGSIGMRSCIFPFIYTSILADGSIFPCCGDFKPARVKSYDFAGIFNHPYLRMLRGALADGQKLPACTKCMQTGA